MQELNSQASPQRRILIVDGHPLVRRGLSELINGESDLTVCAASSTHDEALAAIAAHQPDLVITELFFEESDGLVLVKDICAAYKFLPVLVLSLYDSKSYTQRALRAGARAFVSKRELTETLLSAIRGIPHSGQKT